jgi:hypothetical protein
MARSLVISEQIIGFTRLIATRSAQIYFKVFQLCCAIMELGVLGGVRAA